MKQMLIKIFWPILSFFETQEEPSHYKESHRLFLNVVGVLFLFLSMVSAWAGYTSGEVGSLIPILVFFSVGFVALVLGTLGSNGAVAKIWGFKK